MQDKCIGDDGRFLGGGHGVLTQRSHRDKTEITLRSHRDSTKMKGHKLARLYAGLGKG